ncbi:MAG: hypothetical protein K0R80_163 [Clostridia bacterium]|jgi:hypothetical protein|nr:hypothetical protein [Clostridia bacterium]
MANIASIVALIRDAILGKDVREALASGIETINTEVENTTQRQTTLETNMAVVEANEVVRIDNELGRVEAEDQRVSEVDAIVAAYDAATKANLSVEVSNARTSTVKNKAFGVLDDRLEEIEQDHKTHLAESAQEINLLNSQMTVVSNDIIDIQAEIISNYTSLDTKIDAQASGSPKGVYPTLADLETAYPTGNTNIYIVSADGHWYYWSGMAWSDGGQYQAVLSSFANKLNNSDAAANITTTSANSNIHINGLGLWFIYSGYSASYQIIPAVAGHIYYARVKITTDSIGKLQNKFRLYYSDGTYTESGISTIPINGISSQLITATKTLNANITIRTATIIGLVTRVNQMVVDLTDLFGIGNEPSLTEFEELLNNFPNAWFDSSNDINFIQSVLLNTFLSSKNDIVEQNTLLIQQSYLPSQVLKTISRNTDKLILWYDIDKKIVYAVDSDLVVTDRIQLYASDDYGITWENVFTANAGIRRFYTLESGYHILNTTSSRLQRVAPDFNGYADWVGDTVTSCLNSALGFAEHDGVILYAEYGNTVGTNYRILKSIDDGVTWTVANDGTTIFHWHSIQVDPYTGYFWACSGDSEDDCKIMCSEDGGATWVTKTSGLQSDRAVGLVFYENEVIWAMDTAGTKPYIMKANKANFVPVQIGEVPYGATTLGVSKTIDGLTFGWSRVEENSSQRESCVLWVTNGITIKEIQKFAIKPENVINTVTVGFTDATMIDDENKWFGNAAGTVLDGLLGFVLPLGI